MFKYACALCVCNFLFLFFFRGEGVCYDSCVPHCWSSQMVSYFVFAVVNVAGGPSGSGKTSLAHKMANIVGCEVVSLESYYKSEQVKDFKYDDFSSLDLSLLSKVNTSVIHQAVKTWAKWDCKSVKFTWGLVGKNMLKNIR